MSANKIVEPYRMTRLARGEGINYSAKGVNDQLAVLLEEVAVAVVKQAKGYRDFRKGKKLELSDLAQARVDVSDALSRMRRLPAGQPEARQQGQATALTLSPSMT